MVSYLAVSDSESGKIIVVDGKGSKDAMHTLEKLHHKSVRLMTVSFESYIIHSFVCSITLFLMLLYPLMTAE